MGRDCSSNEDDFKREADELDWAEQTRRGGSIKSSNDPIGFLSMWSAPSSPNTTSAASRERPAFSICVFSERTGGSVSDLGRTVRRP